MRSSSIAYLQPRYVLSLPERLIRALAASLGGLLYELTQVALPDWVRRTHLYQALVYRFLRLTVELIGGVEQAFPPDSMEAGELAIRKTVGNMVEFAGILTLGLSPLWVLAAASDLTGGTRVYLQAFVKELIKDGLLPDDADIQTVDVLLRTLENTSSIMADLVDVPPLKVQDLQNSWQSLKLNKDSLPAPARLARIYQLLQQTARQEKRSIGMLSSSVAAGALRAGYRLGSLHIFEYYQGALGKISQDGWWTYIRRAAKPYSIVARSHFDPTRITYTEKGLRRLNK